MITTNTIKKITGGALLSGSLALVGLGLASGTAQAFNPQPEPPTNPAVSINGHFTSPGTVRGFNPQPEPPTKVANGGIRSGDGSV